MQYKVNECGRQQAKTDIFTFWPHQNISIEKKKNNNFIKVCYNLQVWLLNKKKINNNNNIKNTLVNNKQSNSIKSKFIVMSRKTNNSNIKWHAMPVQHD